MVMMMMMGKPNHIYLIYMYKEDLAFKKHTMVDVP